MASSPSRVQTHGRPPAAERAFRSPASRDPLLQRLLTLLQLRPGDLLVQLGCAFPEHLPALAELVPLRYQALVVDGSPERLAPFVGSSKLRPVAMDPLHFAAYPMQCDRILLEHTLLRGGASDTLARGLFGRLSAAGRLLAVGAAPRARPAGEACRAPALPPRTSALRLARILEGAGFEVTRHPAPLGSGRADFLLGVKAATSARGAP